MVLPIFLITGLCIYFYYKKSFWFPLSKLMLLYPLCVINTTNSWAGGDHNSNSNPAEEEKEDIYMASTSNSHNFKRCLEIVRASKNLYNACKTSNIQEVNRILEQNQNIDVVNTIGPNGYTPLGISMFQKNVGVVKSLLAHKDIDLFMQDGHQRTVFKIIQNNQNGYDEFFNETMNLLVRDPRLYTPGTNRSFLAEFYNWSPSIITYILKHRRNKINVIDLQGIAYLAFRNANINIKNSYPIKSWAALPNLQVNAKDEEGTPYLHHIISTKNLNMLERLLQDNKIAVDATSIKGETTLMAACKNKWKAGIERLLENKNIEINATDEAGNTALHWLCWESNLSSVDQEMNKEEKLAALSTLLAHDQIDIAIRNKQGETALMIACKTYWGKEKAKLLITHKSRRCNINEVDGQGNTALMIACKSGDSTFLLKAYNEKAAKFLLEHNSNIHQVNQNGETALLLACQSKLSGIIDLCLKKDIKCLKVADQAGNTPLHSVVFYGKAGNRGYNDEDPVSVLKKLLTYKQIAIDSRNKKGETVLMLACQKYKEKALEFLLPHYINVNDVDHEGNTALHTVASLHKYDASYLRIERLAMPKILLRRQDINVNIRNNAGEVPLVSAVKREDKNLALLLLADSRLDITMVDDNTLEKLCQYAFKQVCYKLKKYAKDHPETQHNTHARLVCLMLKQNYPKRSLAFLTKNRDKININFTDEEGYTLLARACQYHHTKIAEYLLSDSAANPNTANNKGETPMSLAQKKG